jgi:hypothetical protein
MELVQKPHQKERIMEEVGMAELVKLIVNYGVGIVCLAVLISLHIYNVRITLPKVAEQAQKQISGLVIVFRQELAEERRQCHEDHSILNNGVLRNQITLERLSERLKVHAGSDSDLEEAKKKLGSSDPFLKRHSRSPDDSAKGNR